MKRAAIYVRVSTDEQARHGYSIETQLDVVRKYAKENKYNVVGEYVEAGASAHGNIRKRPELMRLIRDVEQDLIDTILFIKIDRWFRNVKDYYAVQTILDNHHVQWRAVMEDYETETSAGKFKVNIMLSIAQAESERTSERIKMVFDRKKANGEVTNPSSVPIGITVKDKRLVADPETAHIAKEFFQKYMELRNYPAVCRYINEKYNLMFAYLTMRNWLHNHRYVEVGIIDQETFDLVQETFQSRAPRRKKQNGVYLFSGIIRCADCGYMMRVSGNRGGEGCYNCGRRARYGDRGCTHKKYISEHEIEEAIIGSITQRAEEYNIDLQKMQKATPAVDKAAIKRKMTKLADLYMNDLIEKSEYETRYSELRKALESVPKVIPLINTSQLENALSTYKTLNQEHKRAFWGRILKEVRVDSENNVFFDLQSL